MSDLPKTHPLWNRSPEWIATRASMAVEQVDKIPHGADTVVIKSDWLVALVYMVRAEAGCTAQAEARVKELETQLLINAEFGDPLENAMDRIKELLSMFNCQSCYDKRWVVGVEGAWPGGGDPGNECQVPCPDCNLPTKTRLLAGEIVEPS